MLDDIHVIITEAEVALDNLDYLGALEAAERAWGLHLGDEKLKSNKDLQTSLLELKLKIHTNKEDLCGQVLVVFEQCKCNLTHAAYFYEAAQMLRHMRRFQDALNFCEYSYDLDGRSTRTRLLLNALQTDLKIGQKVTLTAEQSNLHIPDLEMFRVTAGVIRGQKGASGSAGGSRTPRAGGNSALGPTAAQVETAKKDEAAAAKVVKPENQRGAAGARLAAIINTQVRKATELVALPTTVAVTLFSIDVVAIALLLGVAFFLNRLLLGCWAVVPMVFIVSQFHRYLRRAEQQEQKQQQQGAEKKKETTPSTSSAEAYFGIPPTVLSSFALCLALVAGVV